MAGHDQTFMISLLSLCGQLGVPREERERLTNIWHEREEELRRILNDKNATEEEKAAAQRYLDGIAKGITALATGIRDAVVGFQSGDPVAGSAAIMDICATIATIGGAMTAAGGPPGAIVGALFSVISMILRMFVKEQKSVTAQIEEVMRILESEEELQGLTVAQQAIGAFIDTLMPPSNSPFEPVKYKWSSEEINMKLNVIEGPSINAIRHATTWLNKEKSQQLPLWGHVLAAQCEAYVNYLFALTIAITSLDLTGIPEGGKLIEEKLTRAFRSNDQNQLNFLRRVTPAAQSRGMVWSIAYQRGGGAPTDSGPLQVRDTITGEWTDLGHAQRKFAVAKRKTIDAEDANPFVAVFSLQSTDNPPPVPGVTYRNRANSKMFFLQGMWPLAKRSKWKESIPGLRDLAATPGEKELQVYVYFVTDKNIYRNVHDAGDFVSPVHQVSPTPTDYKFDSVCAVSSPQTVDGYDPRHLEGEKNAVYAGGAEKDGKRFIQAFFESDAPKGVRQRLITPFGKEAIGMAADRKRLWIFNRELIACVTHSEAKRYVLDVIRNPHLLNSQTPPEWAVYNLPDEFAGKWTDSGIFPGIHDIAPCDDGTLLAVFRTKETVEPRIFSATPTFVRRRNTATQTGSIVIQGLDKDYSGHTVVTSGWTRYDTKGNTGWSLRIYKHAIFCWPLIETLTKVLGERVAAQKTPPNVPLPDRQPAICATT